MNRGGTAGVSTALVAIGLVVFLLVISLAIGASVIGGGHSSNHQNSTKGNNSQQSSSEIVSSSTAMEPTDTNAVSMTTASPSLSTIFSTTTSNSKKTDYLSSSSSSVSSSTTTSVVPSLNSTIASVNEPDTFVSTLGTFYADGNYYAVFQINSTSYVEYSHDGGDTWINLGAITTGSTAVYFDGRCLDIAYSPTASLSIYLDRAMPTSIGLSWTNNDSVPFYHLPDPNVGNYSVVETKPASLTVSPDGSSIWVVMQTWFVYKGTSYPNQNYSVIKLNYDLKANNYAMQSGFPRQVSGFNGHADYGTDGVSVIPIDKGVATTILTCATNSTMLAYEQTYFDSNSSFGSPIPIINLTCGGQDMENRAYVLAANPLGGTSSYSILYYDSYTPSCGACEYINDNISVITISSMNGSILSTDRYPRMLSGGFTGTLADYTYVFANSQIWGEATSLASGYVSANGEQGPFHNLNWQKAWSMSGSPVLDSSGRTLVLLCQHLVSGDSNTYVLYLIGFNSSSS